MQYHTEANVCITESKLGRQESQVLASSTVSTPLKMRYYTDFCWDAYGDFGITAEKFPGMAKHVHVSSPPEVRLIRHIAHVKRQCSMTCTSAERLGRITVSISSYMLVWVVYLGITQIPNRRRETRCKQIIIRNIFILSRAVMFISSHFRVTAQYFSHVYVYILCTNDIK
jgi:hypothetical protein